MKSSISLLMTNSSILVLHLVTRQSFDWR